jgi:hypothetical protein
MSKVFLKFLELQIFITLGWCFFFSLNETLNLIGPYKDYISLLFLPAGYKIVLACLLKWQCFLGLFIGSIITGFTYLDNNLTQHIWFFSLFSAFSPILTVTIIDYFFNLGLKLSKINLQKMILIAALYAFICTALHNTYLLILGEISLIEYQQDSLAMFIGDITGAMLFLSILSYYRFPLIKLANRYL